MSEEKINKIYLKINQRIEELAESEERSIEHITNLFESAKLKVKETDKDLSDIKIAQRAINNIRSHFTSQKFGKGVPFNFVPMGVAISAKDMNKKLREEILKDWAEPPNRKNMILKGYIMTMDIDDDKVPIKKILKSHNEKDVGLIIDDGEICEPEDTPIPRDYKEKNEYGDNEYENFRYSKPLFPNWSITLFGIGFFEGSDKKDGVKRNPIKDGLVCRVQFYGDLANPKKESFVCNKSIWFMPCHLEVTKGKKTNDEIIFATGKSTIEIEEKDLAIEKIVKAINKKMSLVSNKLKKLALDMKQNSEVEGDDKLLKEAEVVKKRAIHLSKYEKKDYIPFIDLDDVGNFHYQHVAVWQQSEEDDEDVLVVAKDKKSGFDKIDFNKFALVECNFEKVFKKENSVDKIILSDWSVDDNLFTTFAPELKSSIEIPQNTTILISLTTSRGEMVWDVDQGKLVKNPDEAKVNPKVRGIKILQLHDEIEIGEILEGDE